MPGELARAAREIARRDLVSGEHDVAEVAQRELRQRPLLRRDPHRLQEPLAQAGEAVGDAGRDGAAGADQPEAEGGR